MCTGIISDSPFSRISMWWSILIPGMWPWGLISYSGKWSTFSQFLYFRTISLDLWIWHHYLTINDPLPYTNPSCSRLTCYWKSISHLPSVFSFSSESLAPHCPASTLSLPPPLCRCIWSRCGDEDPSHDCSHCLVLRLPSTPYTHHVWHSILRLPWPINRVLLSGCKSSQFMRYTDCACAFQQRNLYCTTANARNSREGG